MLRDYQSALVAELSAALPAARSVVLQLPTGGGKTHIASTLIKDYRRRGKRIWFVCHRREIVQQASRALEALGVSHGIVGHGHERWAGWQVQVCSVHSLPRAMRDLPAPDLIVWDECHHVAAPSWSRIKDEYPGAEHLGLTATPERLDGRGLAEWFGQLIAGPSTRELIEHGHLSAYRLFAPTIPDLRGVATRAGDYEATALAERMSGATLVGDVVDHYRRLASDARAVAFAVSVEASRRVAARFNAAGIPAAHIDGSTPYVVRERAIEDLEAGRIRVLSNVEVFTEGFDLPVIDAVILLRPTRSFALYRQMVGRGLRVAPGKSPTVILDHAGLAYEHDLPDEPVTWSLEGKTAVAGTIGIDRLRRCPKCSAIHSWAMTCQECGHTYEVGDRTIRQVYGELIEVRSRLGCEGLSAFARRIGRHHGTIQKLIRAGMPVTAEGLVPVEDALGWLDARGTVDRTAHPTEAEGKHERQGDFARRIGATPSGVRKMRVRGLPAAANGWVPVQEGLEWVRAWRASNWRARRGKAPLSAGMPPEDYPAIP